MQRTLGILTVVALCALQSPLHAAGAVAIAEPADIAADGYAAGISYGIKSPAEADERAVRECLAVEDAPVTTRKLCKVVRSFENQCGAVALDPKAGTPGAGWAVADSLTEARRDALQRCEQTAGSERQGECRVTAEGCDGKAR